MAKMSGSSQDNEMSMGIGMFCFLLFAAIFNFIYIVFYLATYLISGVLSDLLTRLQI